MSPKILCMTSLNRSWLAFVPNTGLFGLKLPHAVLNVAIPLHCGSSISWWYPCRRSSLVQIVQSWNLWMKSSTVPRWELVLFFCVPCACLVLLSQRLLIYLFLLYFARTSYNKLQRLKDNWPGDHDSKNQLPLALEKRYTTVKTTCKNLAFGRHYCSCATCERAREVPCDVTLRTN